MELEIWKDIKGYEGYYQISNLGRVRGLTRIVKCRAGSHRTINEKLYKANKGTNYLFVGLRIGKHKKYPLLHRLIATAFIPNPDNKPCVNHIDGDKHNNKISNLEWCTPSENNKHAFATGLSNSHGENHSQNILTAKQALEIRSLKKIKSQNDLANQYGVSRTTISSIHTGRSWTKIY